MKWWALKSNDRKMMSALTFWTLPRFTNSGLGERKKTMKTVTRKYRSRRMKLQLWFRNLTMFWVQFTHFYASRWSWKPSDEYNPEEKKEVGYGIQWEERQWRPTADCAQYRTVREERQARLWSGAPPLGGHTQKDTHHFLSKNFSVKHLKCHCKKKRKKD